QEVIKKLWDAKLGYENQMLHTPDIFLCIGGKVLDFSNTVGFDQLVTIMRSEFLEADDNEDIILISSKTEIL
ncbi:MAG: hypothetical protein GX227_05480, partial [Clostridiaceae bacterium]|nr:hypothetical protein [Clostridiaceae bacterium]